MNDELNESLWYLTVALEAHYRGTAVEGSANKVIDLLRKILHLEAPHNGGGIGICAGWLEEIQEAEARTPTPPPNSPASLAAP